MEIIKLDATLRSQAGKAPARRLRREGKVPAIAYGKALQAVSIAISPKGLSDVLKSAHGQNTVVELGVDGGAQKITVLLREYTVHPITRDVLHADFLQIKLDEPVEVEVPFVCTGKALGVVSGGIMRQVYRRLPVYCLPEKIPVSIEHDISSLDLGDTVKAAELTLPEGVTVRLPPDRTVAGVVMPEKEKVEEAAPGAAATAEGAAAGATAAGAAAAPGAGAAAAPAAGGGDDKKAAGGKDDKKAAGGKDDKKKK